MQVLQEKNQIWLLASALYREGVCQCVEQLVKLRCQDSPVLRLTLYGGFSESGGIRIYNYDSAFSSFDSHQSYKAISPYLSDSDLDVYRSNFTQHRDRWTTIERSEIGPISHLKSNRKSHFFVRSLCAC